MSLIRMFLVVLLAHSALCTEPLILIPCSKTNITCLTHSAQLFLDKTRGGIPELNIQPIDTMIQGPVDVNLFGTKVILKNSSVHGLENLNISRFAIYTKPNAIVLEIIVNPEIRAVLEVNGTEYGSISYVGPVNSTAYYTYQLVPNDKGVEYFSYGPEMIDCHAQAIAQIKLTAADRLMLKDKDNPDKIKEKLVCRVVKLTFHTIILNLREAAKHYPKTSFLTDL